MTVAIKRILINATYHNAIRIAYTQGIQLSSFEVEHAGEENSLGNIYKGKITSVNNSLECAFVDIGLERQGMLPFKRLVNDTNSNESSDSVDYERVSKQLRVGRPILVQVDKEARAQKGAALTAQISLAGRTIVHMPGKPIRSVSRAVNERTRAQLQDVADQLKIPDNHGIIMRTLANRVKAKEIQTELDHMLNLWKKIQQVQEDRQVKAPALIYTSNDLVNRLFRDKFHSDITEVLIDDEEFFEKARKHAEEFFPSFADRVKHYQGAFRLFDQYRVEQKIASCYEREVALPSGGSIIIDPTEALISVDVNSGKSRGSSNFSGTALTTNLEAADELLHQLNIRNIGGLIVVDFIDMDEDQAKLVEDRVGELLEQDRAATKYCPISELGLMEIQREKACDAQRLTQILNPVANVRV